ncbi:hypothetical protein ACF0H5_010381 [Mactra antiquata]
MEEVEVQTLEEKPCTAKLSRKIGEKLRRDRLNCLITQLAEEIPIIKYAHKRLDKSAILRLTVSYMELHLGLKKKRLCNRGGISGSCLLKWLKKMTDDALMIINKSGTILYISTKITDHIGFYQTDMLGHNIEQFIHRNDLYPLMSLFSKENNSQSDSTYATFKPSMLEMSFAQLENLHTENAMYIRLLKANRRKRTAADAREYETFMINCQCEKKDSSNRKLHSDGRQWMLTLLKPISKEPVKEIGVQISEFMKNNEWASMHSLDGKILAQDHRCALFHGRMPSEAIGKSPYGLIHEDDLPMIALSHREIMTNHETCTVFRMRTAMNSIIYVQSQSIIVKESWTKKPKSIVSVNTILDLEKGIQLLNVQREAVKTILKDMEHSANDKDKKTISGDESNGCEKSDSGEQDGENLTNIYEEKAKHYPELYSQSDCKETADRIVESEKRAYECVESDISYPDSFVGGFSDSSESQHFEDRDSPTHDENPVLKRLLNSKKRVVLKTDPCESTITNQGKSEPMPLLKGLLEDKVKMNNQLFSNDSWQKQASDLKDVNVSDGRRFDFTYRLHCDDKTNQNVYSRTELRSHHFEDGASTSSGNTHNSLTQNLICLGGEASSTSVQSPTVGSTEPCVDGSGVETMVYNKFTKQLESKHALLRKTLTSQKTTLEILREQIQKSHNNVLLKTEEKNIHDALLERLFEAETQVEVQGQLLGELEKDIETHKAVK